MTPAGAHMAAHLADAVLAPVREYRRVFEAVPAQVGQARRFLAGILGDCAVAADAITCLSEFAANACLFSLLSFCVAIAAIGRQADLRPALSDYLLLAAACCGTCETGQPPSSAGQLRHGYHRTRRVRREIRHSASGRAGGTFTVRVLILGGGRVRIEVADDGGQWVTRTHGDGRSHGLAIVASLACDSGVCGDAMAGRTSWATFACPDQAPLPD